ncbi:Polypyrimidine tract-binding protein isoform 1 [Hibiscus syriacus]|uniref:Polypyrimidine tract-binding protein isoform 1 n=1 Tax=Hibiscus syriacus TaxID=106335 RepID=A0A6A2WUA7_HIBSY|nr:Polypyrimidine tract-binding protein isoform 1 [Hibiscus syriacus]
MLKLASARESRIRVLMLIALGLIILVNIHDLLAHLAGIDYRFALMGFDPQLALVEFSVPLVQILGSLLFFLEILFLFVQAEKGYGFFKLERHALGMLIAGQVLWVVGSVHNSCQIYEQANAHVQILQQCVHIPFLIGSVLFMVGAILNGREQSGVVHHGLQLLTTSNTRLRAASVRDLRIIKCPPGLPQGQKMGMVRDMWEPDVYDRGLTNVGGGRASPSLPTAGRKMEVDEIKATTAAAVAGTKSPTPYMDVLLARTRT